MAAALAATLPSEKVAPAPAQPQYEAIPASMSKVIDVEVEIPITSVQLDGMVVSKIIKHAGDARTATGLLLGLDLDGTLEVSNSFPLPHGSNDEEDKASKANARYQGNMLRSLKEVQGDDSVVGSYLATNTGAFLNSTLVEMQAFHQERLRQGGIVVVHDVAQTKNGNAAFRAFRLTKAFFDAHKKSDFGTTSLIAHRLTFSSILQEVPLKIRTNPLMNAFLEVMTTPAPAAPLGDSPLASSSSAQAPVPPSFAALDLGGAPLARKLEQTLDAVDASRTEEGNLAYLQRQIARERTKADAYIQKRREENAVRVQQGLAPLPEEDVSRLFKVPPEPSRLESMLFLGQVDAHAKTLEAAASIGLAKMYAARASAGV